MYAICRNGGMVNESIEGRFETKAEAWAVIEAEWAWEYDHVLYCDDLEAVDALDVVKVLEDGSITTEC